MREAYLDHAASTPVDPRVVAAMLPYFHEHYGNPSSSHRMGIAADRGVRRAREQIAAATGVDPAHVIFTSGGTEANALAILGAAARGTTAVTSLLEHPSVAGSIRQRAGERVHVVAVGQDGTVDAAAFAEACLAGEVAVAACMLVSNELGTVQPVREIGERLRAGGFRGHFHVDAVQAFGKVPVTFAELNADSLAVSAHKLHGPKGVGALLVRVRELVRPLWGGGKHEGGARPGTENAPGIVGFGCAAELAAGGLAGVSALRDRLVAGVLAAVPGARVACEGGPRAPHIAALVFPDVRPEVLVHALEAEGVFASAGAACAARDKSRSPVARALGIAERDGLVRFSLARVTTPEEIDQAVRAVPVAMKAARP
jgi:cysteine desulfurase